MSVTALTKYRAIASAKCLYAAKSHVSEISVYKKMDHSIFLY